MRIFFSQSLLEEPLKKYDYRCFLDEREKEREREREREDCKREKNHNQVVKKEPKWKTSEKKAEGKKWKEGDVRGGREIIIRS